MGPIPRPAGCRRSPGGPGPARPMRAGPAGSRPLRPAALQPCSRCLRAVVVDARAAGPLRTASAAGQREWFVRVCVCGVCVWEGSQRRARRPPHLLRLAGPASRPAGRGHKCRSTHGWRAQREGTEGGQAAFIARRATAQCGGARGGAARGEGRMEGLWPTSEKIACSLLLSSCGRSISLANRQWTSTLSAHLATSDNISAVRRLAITMPCVPCTARAGSPPAGVLPRCDSLTRSPQTARSKLRPAGCPSPEAPARPSPERSPCPLTDGGSAAREPAAEHSKSMGVG